MTEPSQPTGDHAPGSAPDERWPAFEAMVREQYGALCAYAYRYVHDRDTAEEVVQDALFRVWQHRERLTDVDLIRYTFRSAANAAISRWRHERAEQRRDMRLREKAVDDVAPPPEMPDDLEARVRDAIDALPERCRLVFLLSRDAGLTYPAIAERLGISVKTVENQMVKALRRLRVALHSYLAIPLVASGVTELLRKLH